MQAIRGLRTKYDFKEPSSLVDAQAINGDGIPSIPKVFGLIDKIAETKETWLPHTMKPETEIARLNNLASERMLWKRKTADTLEQSSGAVASLAASLKKHTKMFVTSPSSGMNFN